MSLFQVRDFQLTSTIYMLVLFKNTLKVMRISKKQTRLVPDFTGQRRTLETGQWASLRCLTNELLQDLSQLSRLCLA